jgi:dimethylhistidine N-methyltransferase
MSGSPHEISSPSDSEGVVREIVDGLALPQKALPSKLLYDDAGSELFQRITELPTYYLTRAEKRLLHAHAADIVTSMASVPGKERALVEFGASDETKAVLLLDVPEGRFSTYVPIDISSGVLLPIRERMQITHPEIEVHTLAADFLRPLAMPEALTGTQVVYFLPGSTIGQYAPGAVIAFLQNVGRALVGATRPYFVIGTDICRDPLHVLPAYNDPGGVSKAFNLNILAHINDLTGSDLDPRGFGHEALWNPGDERVDIFLTSRHEQSASIAGRVIHFAAGERIQIGMSYKYGKERFIAIAAAAGWKSAGFWQDAESLFGIHLFEGDGS